MKSILLSFFMIWLTGHANAQHLKQKGFIGIVPQPLTETVAKYLELRSNEGAIIKGIIPGGAASQMGVQENDVLLSINGQKIREPKDVVEISGRLTSGESITMTVNRNKQELTLKGTISARPIGYADDISVELGEFAIEGGHTRSVLLRPKKSTGKLPVIYLLQGYPCFSIAYLPPDFPYRTAINAFLKKGYAVYLVEKAGMGDGISAQPCSQAGFNSELALFKKGYEQLQSLAGIDRNNIIIFGHSLGGFMAPLIAEQYKPRAVVVYGCGVRPWHDYLVDLVREQSPYQGHDYAACEDSLKRYRDVLYKYFFEKKSPQQLISENPENLAILKTLFSFDGRDQLVQRHYTFWQQLNDHNLVKAWKNTESHVLSIFGEADIAALKPADMERIATIVNHYHPGNAEYLFVPKTNHDMIKTGSMKENIQIQFSPQYNQYLKNNFNFELIDKIDQWLKSKLS